MKLNIKALFFICVMSLSFFSCSDDDNEVAAPSIGSIEIGVGNSRTGYVGANLHVQTEVLAPGLIDNIRMVIHQEDESVSATKSAAWVLDEVFTGVYANVKNATFHEHVDIPATALTGTYHLHLYVTDKQGNQTMLEEEFTVKAPIADGNLPSITIGTAPTLNEAFTNGEKITISGNVSDVLGLSGIYIGLVKTSDGLADASVNATNSITLLHNHDFTDPKAYTFSASITVGAVMDNNITPKAVSWPVGDYYILVKVPGIDGEVGFSAHYPIKIQ